MSLILGKELLWKLDKENQYVVLIIAVVASSVISIVIMLPPPQRIRKRSHKTIFPASGRGTLEYQQRRFQMALKKATKEQSKLRLAIYGLSGGGKTYSALAIAKGIIEVFGGKIAVLDTEFRSASKYANIFDFDTDDFGEPTIENYLAFIEMVKEDPNVTVLIIDSLTHAWQWCLGEVDRLAKGSSKNDNRNAWRTVSPKYDRLVHAIITAPFHVIGTMRAKTEWSSAKENESKASHRETLAPVQRDGFEYEFDMLMEVNANHFGSIIKDRSSKFQDEVIEKPGVNLGKKLAEWLKDGSPSRLPSPPQKTDEQQLKDALTEMGSVLDSEDFGKRIFTVEEKDVVREKIRKGLGDIPKDQYKNKLIFIEAIMDEIKKLLHQRINGDSGTAETGTEKEDVKNTSLAPVSETPETETPPVVQAENEQSASDDGFVDDIPWADGEELGRKGSRKSSKSIAASISEELAIF
jgi:hypothetical protein